MASQRPARSQQPGWQSPPPNSPQRPVAQHGYSSGSVQFQPLERGDRAAPISSRYSQQQQPTSPRDRNLPPTPYNMQDEEYDVGGGDSFGTRVGRKKSLVRPERQKLEPGHRLYHYQTHAAQLEDEGRGPVKPSTTGQAPQLRRGISVLGRDDGARLNRRNTRRNSESNISNHNVPVEKKSWLDGIAPGPKDAWMIYCWLLTCWIPGFVLAWFGIKTPEQARAWREKMGLLSLIFVLMAAVGFLTFGFTQTVCGKPPLRYRTGTIDKGSLIINGFDYDFSEFKHPPVNGFFDGQQNPLFTEPYNAGGMDATFLFQNVNRNCRGLITPASNTPITNANGALAWYFPCNLVDQNGKSFLNSTGYDKSTFCHTDPKARQALANHPPNGQVFYTWDDVKNPSRNLVVFESSVLDLNLLQTLNRNFVQYPSLFDELKTNNNMTGHDVTMTIYRNRMKSEFKCLQDVVTVGFIDTNTIGCVASEVVLVLSLVFIIGVVAIRFVMAVIFGWFVSWRLGSFGPTETYSQRMERAAEIENWTDDIYRPAPSRYRPTVRPDNGPEKLKKDRKSAFLPNTSRYTQVSNSHGQRPISVADLNFRRGPASKGYLSPPEAPALGYGNRYSRSSTSLTETAKWSDPSLNSSACPWPLNNVVPQPPSDYAPFNFPLAHTICLVTAYSEGESGLRTTLDSIATTDYPNSHKLIMVIADGLVKGSGNNMTTPDIVLTMMKEFIIPPEDVQPHSYVAIADGHKRHNMAKVYAGFYDYDDNTVERSKQQRVPVILIAKCGNPLEVNESKPGNRGKRDSQIVLMAFLQKVMFDERMTTMEYEFFNSIWRVTGITPDRYEYVLCVDADTKVFPDSLTRMAACMSNDPEIMGLCGETKIGNKAESWVTMIQVFEYYISHHLTKAFESMFGGVTCLPGCFSMYRIKSQKGDKGFWVPILANPDIVEHYSENIVDTLHKKNLLLLGEDRYLTTLMLKTFPRRKMMFCPQAVCKTTVPDKFSVLLSQRRRWINSTIHNLAELLLVRDLCGTFCFSMQFVVFMELMGTLVLPAAISFTIYLIVISIIPNHQNTTIPLVLLGIILGLPGLLIVLTSRRLAYVGWMLIYLLSLPIWNFVLPAYAFWHFDDFSWGSTRQVSGEKKGAGHGTADEGDSDVFDSDKIVMKRWAEFERDRRWKSGSTSRDSMYYNEKFDGHSNSPRRDDYAASTRYDEGYRPRVDSAANSNRFSMVSDSEPSYTPPTGYASVENEQYNRLPTVQLPAPLGRPKSVSPNPSPSRSSLDTYNGGVDTSRQRLISTPPHEDHEPVQSPSTIESHMGRMGGGVLRQSTISTQYPVVEQQNPYRFSQPQAASYDDHYSAEPEDIASPRSAAPFIPPAPQGYNNGYNNGHGRQQSRGFSLADNGPVPGPDGVRRVARQQARRSTQQANPPLSGANRYSQAQPRSSTYGGPNLPPGAAPPNTYGYR